MPNFLKLITPTLLAGVLAGCSSYSKAVVKAPEKLAVTERQSALMKAARRAESNNDRIGLFLDAAHHASQRLLESEHDALAQADYNFSVARAIEEILDHPLKPWETELVIPSAAGPSWVVTAPNIAKNPKIDPSSFQGRAADRFDFHGKLVGNRSVKQGVGASMIVSGEFDGAVEAGLPDFTESNNVYIGLTAILRFFGRDCHLELIDPLENETVTISGQTFPLAANYQAPIALAMAELDPKKAELKGFFSPAERVDTARLGLLQRYNPEKIPVLCIHGLGNSVATWMPLVEHLRGNAIIRKNYQFLYFSYPTGLPYPITTAILRQQLDDFSSRYPDHKDFVVLGHSMGGMIARLLITDSHMKLWDRLFDKPPSEMPFSPRTREVMESTLIFEARPDIDSVIFCSASHRGSKIAVKPLGKFGSRLIGNPISDKQVTREALANVRPQPEVDGRRTDKRKHLPNSIELLDPDNPFLKSVNALPIKAGISYHSIIGDRGKGGHLDRSEPVSSDGVVAYWSSHLEGAESETIVPSDHWSHLHALGMDKIERILVNHVR